jgi:hypothetical protein
MARASATELARRVREGIEARDPELDAVRRAARAGLVIPISGTVGFAVGSGQTPLFAIFGAIALLIVVDFPCNRAGRQSPMRVSARRARA